MFGPPMDIGADDRLDIRHVYDLVNMNRSNRQAPYDINSPHPA